MNKKVRDEQRMVQQIMDNFDWQKCHTTMSAIGWEWFFVGVPTIDDLKECAKKLMEKSIEGVKNPEIKFDTYYFTSTGGLKAIAWKNKYGHITQVELEFVLTSWESDGDCLEDDIYKGESKTQE